MLAVWKMYLITFIICLEEDGSIGFLLKLF